jgi:addiction module HigA family antidote
MQMRSPAHPGAILREHMGEALTVSELARHLGVTRANLSMILNGRLGITAAMAVKLADAFPKSRAEFWMDLQSHYDLAQVRKQKRKRIRPILKEAA